MPKDLVKREVNKFISLFTGKNIEYPTQDEFGMSLAYQASVRSNFPGRRQVGAAIVSKYGEVISVASIRAPSKSSNTTLHDELSIQLGYNSFKKKLKSWDDFIKSLHKKKIEKILNETEISTLEEINDFVQDTLDFHPCTHAEIAAIIDAAKLGIPLRNSTLYSTTFPCHLCAKDIISAGINRVIYLEAFPKSKNKELYLELIEIDPKFINNTRVPFDFYSGTGPKCFVHMYSLENRSDNGKIPFLEFEKAVYYSTREKDILNHFQNCIKNNKCKDNQLCNLLKCAYKTQSKK